MKSIILLLCLGTLSWITYSCNINQPGEENGVSQIQDQDTLKRGDYDFPIKKFSLPYSTPIELDTNSLIFMKEKSFDTSYLLHIHKHGSTVQGVCYIVLPSFHRDLEDYYDEKNKLLFFDGFSFNLNINQWERLREKTIDAIVHMSDSIRSISTCLHCPSYSLYFNKQKRETGNSKLQENFRDYDTFILDTIIYPILAKRKMKW